MDIEAKFRTSAMGYNKNDVNEYIEQSAEEYQTKIKEKDDELVKLRNQIKELKSQVEDTSKKTTESNDEKTKIADVLIKAQATAESILEEARQSAIEEKRKIEEDIEKERERLVDLKSELKKLRDSVTETLKIIEKDINNYVEE
ncbi:MAG: DivIVA domain-containing protein [Deltaproteobacteria bacterium]